MTDMYDKNIYNKDTLRYVRDEVYNIKKSIAILSCLSQDLIKMEGLENYRFYGHRLSKDLGEFITGIEECMEDALDESEVIRLKHFLNERY